MREWTRCFLGVLLRILGSACVWGPFTCGVACFILQLDRLVGISHLLWAPVGSAAARMWAVPGLAQSDRLQSDPKSASLLCSVGLCLPPKASMVCSWSKTEQATVPGSLKRVMSTLRGVLNELKTKSPLPNDTHPNHLDNGHEKWHVNTVLPHLSFLSPNSLISIQASAAASEYHYLLIIIMSTWVVMAW
jgi:hypothetical protein